MTATRDPSGYRLAIALLRIKGAVVHLQVARGQSAGPAFCVHVDTLEIGPLSTAVRIPVGREIWAMPDEHAYLGRLVSAIILVGDDSLHLRWPDGAGFTANEALVSDLARLTQPDRGPLRRAVRGVLGLLPDLGRPRGSLDPDRRAALIEIRAARDSGSGDDSSYWAILTEHGLQEGTLDENDPDLDHKQRYLRAAKADAGSLQDD